MPIEPGRTGAHEYTVTAADTAIAVGSGDVPVLATPRVLALLERATVEAVAADLDPGTTTVGVQVAIDHLAPTPVGALVRAEATLEDRAGRRLVFAVRLLDRDRPVARGRVVRALVDRESFLAALPTSTS